MSADYQLWRSDVLNFLAVCKNGTEYKALEKELTERGGVAAPLERMGFQCWGDFLYDIKDIFWVGMFPHEMGMGYRARLFLFINPSVLLTVPEDVLDVFKLVQGQEKGKVRRRMDGTTNQPTNRQVMRVPPEMLKGKGRRVGVPSFPLQQGPGHLFQLRPAFQPRPQFQPRPPFHPMMPFQPMPPFQSNPSFQPNTLGPLMGILGPYIGGAGSNNAYQHQHRPQPAAPPRTVSQPYVPPALRRDDNDTTTTPQYKKPLPPPPEAMSSSGSSSSTIKSGRNRKIQQRPLLAPPPPRDDKAEDKPKPKLKFAPLARKIFNVDDNKENVDQSNSNSASMKSTSSSLDIDDQSKDKPTLNVPVPPMQMPKNKNVVVGMDVVDSKSKIVEKQISNDIKPVASSAMRKPSSSNADTTTTIAEPEDNDGRNTVSIYHISKRYVPIVKTEGLHRPWLCRCPDLVLKPGVAEQTRTMKSTGDTQKVTEKSSKPRDPLPPPAEVDLEDDDSIYSEDIEESRVKVEDWQRRLIHEGGDTEEEGNAATGTSNNVQPKNDGKPIRRIF